MVRSEDKKAAAPREEPKHSALLTFLPSYLPLLVLSFLYLWLVVEPRLIYFGIGTVLPDAPPFATGRAFLRDSLGTPGGFVTYVSGLLSLGFYHSWLGAAIVTLAGLGLAELSRRHLARAGCPLASLAAMLPPISLFLIYSQYEHPLPTCLAVSTGLLLALAFEDLPLRRPVARIAAFCLLAAGGFWLAGAGSLAIFAILATLFGVFVRRDWRAAVLPLPASAAIAWALSEYVFLISARQGFLTQTPLERSATGGLDAFLKVLISFLYGLVPAAVLLASVVGLAFARRRQRPAVRHKKVKEQPKHVATQRRWLSLRTYVKLALPVLPVVLMGVGLYAGYDGNRKPYFLSNYYWHQKQWDKILELAERLPKTRTNPYVNHDILRALYHTGRLPYDMFRFPLVPEGLLLTHDTWESDLSQLKLSDLFLELGHVNMAQKLASELVATKGNLGPAVEEVAWISIVKGQPAAARVYLEALRKDPIRRGEAESLLNGLDNGLTPQQVDRVARIRSCLRDEAAGPTGPEPVDQWLAALVERNPRNRMAFEYLMACYLLSGRVEKVAENVKRFPDLGYQGIPTLYEEAIVIHYGNQGRMQDLARINVSQETIKRYETFLQLRYSMRPQNQQAVLNLLIRDFGSRYFFYYSFGRVGVL
ncbi:MAG: DUF6057 family protein [Phycisphaerales bacterium]